MITFATLFLGLLTGSRDVAVEASGQVAAVELRLDGAAVAMLRKPPFETEVDFGPELTGHELVAVAFDSDGAELSRAAQLINVPRPSVESDLLLDDWHQGRPGTARLIWRSTDAAEPEGISISLDGAPLEVSDPGRFELPSLDPQEVHYLVAEMAFREHQLATAEVVFGGRFGDSVPTALTAVPMSDLRRGDLAQAASRLRGAGGEELPVVALDRGSAVAVFVRADGAVAWLQTFDATLRRRPGYARLGLEPADRVVLMSARQRPSDHPQHRYSLFPVSDPLSILDHPLPRALATLGFRDSAPTPERLIDAVAVAGMHAAASRRRRAVVLVTDDCASVSGSWRPAVVRRYLEELKVPVLVWQMGSEHEIVPEAGLCAGARRIANSHVLLREMLSLNKELGRQHIVWIEGERLPGSIVVDVTDR